MLGLVQPLNAEGMIPILLIPDTGECNGCAAKGFCKLPSAECIEVEPGRLPPGVRHGDRVNVDFLPGYRVWLAFSIFILPLILMLVGAVLGTVRGEAWAMGLGFTGLLIGFLCGWLLHRAPATRNPVQITRC